MCFDVLEASKTKFIVIIGTFYNLKLKFRRQGAQSVPFSFNNEF